MTENKKKGLECKHCWHTPFTTYIVCRKFTEQKVLQDLNSGNEWDDSVCPCEHWKERK